MPHKQNQTKNNRNNPSNGHGRGGVTIATGPTYPTQINRTRTKVPTKRKVAREEALEEAMPVESYQLFISMPRDSPSSGTQGPRFRGGMRGGRGRGGLG